MSSVLQMNFDAFLSADKKPAAFRDLIAECLSRRRTLSFRISANAVAIETEQATSTEIRLSGKWTTPSLRSAPADDLGVKLILPLVFNAVQVQLPHEQLYTLGHAFRPIADFFARNVFLAVLRDAPIAFVEKTTDKISANHLRALRRHYFYILKSEFSENCFQDRNAEDALNFVLANAYLPVLNFTNPLLQRGGETLRKGCVRETQNDLAPLKARIMETRTAVMSLYES